jgi:EmrB/QacA subfamily drug resistance transporter
MILAGARDKVRRQTIDRLRHLDYKYLVAIVFITGLFLDILDATVVNVALPTLGRDFSAGATSLEWVVTGYLLSLVVWIPASGWIGDRFGTKRTFIFAMALFTLGSALCGQAKSIEELIAFRLLQGVGGGMMTPVGIAMLFRVFPPQERAAASAFVAVPALLAPVLGPVLGGWLVDGPGWRWIFYLNVPVGILGVILASILLREHKEESAGRFDALGFVLSGGGLALVLYALSRAPADGWTSSVVLTTGLAGLFALALLVLIELRVSEPMLDFRLYVDRMFRSANLAFFMQLAGLFGLLFLLPLYLQDLRGMSAMQSGLTSLPQGIAMGVTLPIASRLYPRIGPRRMLMGGLTVVALTSASMVFVGLDTSLWVIRAIMLVRGVGIAFAGVSVQAAAFANVQPRSMGRASSLFRTNTQVGAALGVAILATVLASRTTAHLSDVGRFAGQAAQQHAQLLAFHDAFFVAAILGFVGLAFAFLIRDEDAAATLRQPSREAVQEPV